MCGVVIHKNPVKASIHLLYLLYSEAFVSEESSEDEEGTTAKVSYCNKVVKYGQLTGWEKDKLYIN